MVDKHVFVRVNCMGQAKLSKSNGIRNVNEKVVLNHDLSAIGNSSQQQGPNFSNFFAKHEISGQESVSVVCSKQCKASEPVSYLTPRSGMLWHCALLSL